MLWVAPADLDLYLPSLIKLSFFSRGQLFISASRFDATDRLGCCSVYTIPITFRELV